LFPKDSHLVYRRPNQNWLVTLVLICTLAGVWLVLSQGEAQAGPLTGLVLFPAITAMWFARHRRNEKRRKTSWTGPARDTEAGEIGFLKVFRYNPIAMMLVGPELRIMLTNHRFRDLCGSSARELEGRSIESLVEEGERQTLRDLIDLTLRDLAVDEWRELRFLPRKNEPCWTRVGTECIRDAEGRVVYALVMVENISERKRFDSEREAYRQRLESLSKRLLEAQEEERRHVARELHDELGQSLTAIKLELQALRATPTEPEEIIDQISLGVDRLIEQMRRLSRELRPLVLDDLGLEAAVRWLADRQQRDLGLHVHFTSQGLEQRLPDWVESACYRVVQEALTNIARHAEASAVAIRLERDGDSLRFNIRDDGRGFDLESVRDHVGRGRSMGLLSMEERVTLLGGRFRVRSEAGLGTRVSAVIPLAVCEFRARSDPSDEASGQLPLEGGMIQ
jgi:PAS domain S-box-containing protein